MQALARTVGAPAGIRFHHCGGNRLAHWAEATGVAQAIRFYGIHPGSAGCRQNVQHTVCTLTAPYRTVHDSVAALVRYTVSRSMTVCQQKFDSVPSSVRKPVAISSTVCFHQFDRLFSEVRQAVGLWTDGVHSCPPPVRDCPHPGSTGNASRFDRYPHRSGPV